MPEIAFLKNSILKKISLKDVPGPPSVLEPPSLKSYITPRNLDNISLLMILLFFFFYYLPARQCNDIARRNTILTVVTCSSEIDFENLKGNLRKFQYHP